MKSYFKRQLIVSILALLIAELLIVTCGHAQALVGVEAGANTKGNFAVGFNAGIKTRSITVTVGAQTHTSNKVSLGAAVQAKAAYEIRLNESYSIEPSAGYVFNLHTTDRKGINKHRPLFGLQCSRYIEGRGGDNRIYLSVTNTGEWTFIMIGIQGIFDGRSYCY